MKVIKQFLKVAGIMTFLLFLVTQSFGYSVKSFKCELRNDYLVSATVYEFDVYLLNTSPDPAGTDVFELANIQFGINVPATFRNAGTISVSMVPGSSELNGSQQPIPGKFSFQNAKNTIIMTAMANPGTGAGTVISATSPGTRVARVRLTNTVPFGLTCPMSLNWCFSVTACGYPTKVSAYQNTSAVDVTALGQFTINNLCNPCINQPLNQYTVTMTPTNGQYCEGGNGVLVCLSGSEAGVTYTLNPGNVVGTGSPLCFGYQLEGNYTVTAQRNCTYMTAPMGSAIITKVPLPDPAGPIGGPTTVMEGSTGNAYSVPTIANATAYVWSVTGGAIISGGQGTQFITLDFPMGQCAYFAHLQVLGSNQCGDGIPSSFFDIYVECNLPPPPFPFNVTGGGEYCEGGPGMPVGLDDSELNVNYELFQDNIAFIPPVVLAGTGDALDFGPQPGTHTYTVKGTNPGGETWMNGNAVVIELPWVTPTFVQLGPYCEGEIPDPLPPMSLEGITGIWNPPVINTLLIGTTTYHFIPDQGQCAFPTSMDIVVDPAMVPVVELFLNPNPFCYCDTVTAVALTNIPVNKILNVTFEVDGIVVYSGFSLVYSWHPTAGDHIVKVTITFNPNKAPCWTTNVATATVNLVYNTTVAGTLTWTGAVNNDWHNPQNWSPPQIPNCCWDVDIPEGAPNYPTLFKPGACHDIHLHCWATLLDNSWLTICGCPYVYQCCITYNTLDWHLSSSPIKHATSGYYQDLFGNSTVPQPVVYYLQSFSEQTNSYTEISATNVPLNVMEGYGLWVDCHHCDTIIWGGLWCDSLNIGAICRWFTAFNMGWNLMGNPFVSSIDWDAVVIPGGMTNEVHYIDAATGNDLSYVQFVGGSGRRYIPPMQGFFISAFDIGQLCIGDAQRTHVGANFYYKSDNPKLVVLKASGEQYSDETWIHFNEAAGVEHDGVYDAYKRISTSNPLLPQLFSLTPAGTKMSVNGMPQASTVPVGFTAVQSGTFTINAVQTGEFTKVVLEDLFTGTFTDMLTSAYTFTYTAGDQENRFLLHFSGVSVENNQADLVNIYSSEKTAYVAIPANRTGDVRIMNMLGQEVKEGNLSGVLTKFTLNEPGIYVVQATVNSKVYTQKVIIR